MTSTNLQNLAKIGLLDPVPLSRDLVLRMLASVRLRLRDAALIQNSAETRFDCAYTAIRTLADMGLHLHGFRTSTSKPGHHQTAIGSLTETLAVNQATVRVLDGLRKQRNLTDYDGDSVTDAALQECMAQAQTLLVRVESAIALRADLQN